MGGYGSGQWRSARFATVDQSCVLDLAHLRRVGGLRRDAMVSSSLEWSRGGTPVASAGWRTEVTFERPPRLVLSYRVTGGAQPAARTPRRGVPADASEVPGPSAFSRHPGLGFG
jgi:hypothetical protein